MSALVWASSRSLAATCEIDFSFFSSGYLAVSVPPVYLRMTMYSSYDTGTLLPVGFPIRTSVGRYLFAAHHSFSQLITSFFGSWYQGIRHMLFLAWFILNSSACCNLAFLILCYPCFFTVLCSFQGTRKWLCVSKTFPHCNEWSTIYCAGSFAMGPAGPFVSRFLWFSAKRLSPASLPFSILLPVWRFLDPSKLISVNIRLFFWAILYLYTI